MDLKVPHGAMSKKFFEDFWDLCMNRESDLGYSDWWNVKPGPDNSDEIII